MEFLYVYFPLLIYKMDGLDGLEEIPYLIPKL